MPRFKRRIEAGEEGGRAGAGPGQIKNSEALADAIPGKNAAAAETSLPNVRAPRPLAH
jgi:hypothetical protein